MADDLKRVGLRFTAEGAVDFKKSLKDISAATKENYTELKLAQSQYDKNTSSAQKLADKQKYLQGQTDAYKQKVALLNQQLEEMEKDEKADETAIRKKRAEINEATTKLNGYETSLEEVTKAIENHAGELKDWGDKLETVGGKIENIGKKGQTVGKTLTKTVTVPIVAAAGASVAAWKEVDAAMDIITKKTGASGEALKDMQDRAKNIAETIPTSFEEAAQAVGEVNTRFGLTGDALEELSTQFIKFAEINDTDVSSSVDSVQKALAAFGLDADSAGTLLDSLTSTAQSTGISVDTLASGLVQNGTAFQEMGLSVEQAVAAMGEMEKSGANSDAVMQGLKKALKSAAKEGKPLNTALSELQNTIKNGTGSVDGLTAAYDLFGKSGDQIYTAVKNGTLDFEALGIQVGETGGAVSNTFEETLDPLDKLKATMNTLKDLGSEIVEAAAPMLIEAMKALRDLVVDLKKRWDKLNPQQQQAIIKFAAIAAAIGPVVTALFKFISTTGTGIKTIGKLISTLSASGGLAGVLGAGGPVLIAIAAAIAAGVLLWKNWDKVKAAAQKLGEGIKKAWNGIKTATSTIWNGITSGLSSVWNRITNTARNTWNNLKTAITQPVQAAWQFLQGLVQKIRNLFNFHWELPRLKMPHFSWDWIKIGNIVKLPRIRVQWYKRAYDQAAYYNTPTIRSDGRGFGDGSGGEFAVGERKLQNTVASAIPTKEILSRFDDVIEVIANMSDRIDRMQIVLDSGSLVGSLAPGMGAEMAINTKRNR